MTKALDPSFYPAYAAECGDPSRTKQLGFGTRPALLLLDVCEAYFSASSPLCLPTQDIQRVAGAIERLLGACRASNKNVPIFYTQTWYTRPGAADSGLQALKTAHTLLFMGDHSDGLAGPPSGYPNIHPTAEDVILRKKYPSPFFGTNFSTQLAALGVDTLIIAGMPTSGSVRASTLDSMQAGFRPMVVAEACADRGSETHLANLMDMGAKYGDVVTVEDAVGHIKDGWA